MRLFLKTGALNLDHSKKPKSNRLQELIEIQLITDMVAEDGWVGKCETGSWETVYPDLTKLWH